MNEKDLIDFANWLWDIGRLKVKTQTPPFEDAEYWAKQYIKVRKLNIPDVMPSFYSGFEIKIFESKTIQEGKGALLLNPKDMPRKNEA